MRLIAALIGLCFAAPSFAQEVDGKTLVQVTPKVQMSFLKQNEQGWIGVEFQIEDGWHIYWQNSGDSGMPPDIAIAEHDDIEIGPIAWPAPERMAEGDFMTYGHQGVVTLLRPITMKNTVKSATIDAKVSWLVCKEICIPGSADVTFALPKEEPLWDAIAGLPDDADWMGTYAVNDDTLTMRFALPKGVNAEDAQWFPLHDGVVKNSAEQVVEQDGKMLTITTKKGAQPPREEYDGVLVAQGKQYRMTLHYEEPPPVLNKDMAFITVVLFAFIGGLILNLMPCVLPILSLKALALAKKSAHERVHVIAGGFSYTCGVLVSFLAIAGALIALREAGAAIGWGFQLQSPVFVAILAIIMLLVSLNLWGVFELPVLFGNKAHALGQGDSHLRSFGTGVLAVLVATPCTAPFMAPALGVAATLPAASALLVFAALGLGLAAPYLLICLIPTAQRILPKPGAWMVRFKKLLAIPMLATTIWLVWVLAQLLMTSPNKDMTDSVMDGVETVAYSPELLARYRAEGKPVFIDATAAWCITCKVNERVALRRDETAAFFKEHGIVLMIADWTKRDDEITELLHSFGRDGVPLYVFYPSYGEPTLLPQILTPDLVIELLSPFFTKLA
ncbi:MAG: thioredoxin family protein [Alphaproteobacteria bacterium]|nr:thioredoxin family protein [Alphaproteobacteria bacterium]